MLDRIQIASYVYQNNTTTLFFEHTLNFDSKMLIELVQIPENQNFGAYQKSFHPQKFEVTCLQDLKKIVMNQDHLGDPLVHVTGYQYVLIRAVQYQLHVTRQKF